MFTLQNPLIQQIRQAERLTPIWLLIPLSGIFILFAQLAGTFLFMPILTAWRPINWNEFGQLPSEEIQLAIREALSPQTPAELSFLLISSFAFVFPILAIWLRLYENRSIQSAGFQSERAHISFGIGSIVGFFIFSLPLLTMTILALYVYSADIISLASLGGIAFALVGWIVQGSAEEVIYRGWVMPVASARTNNLMVGIGLSSLLFGLGHGLNSGISFLAIINLVLFGVFASLYALYDGNIWGVCGIHAIWNWAQGNIYGLEVSGLSRQGGSLWNFTETGNDVITGGVFGPEGGLGVTLMLILGCALLIYLDRRANTHSIT